MNAWSMRVRVGVVIGMVKELSIRRRADGGVYCIRKWYWKEGAGEAGVCLSGRVTSVLP